MEHYVGKMVQTFYIDNLKQNTNSGQACLHCLALSWDLASKPPIEPGNQPYDLKTDIKGQSVTPPIPSSPNEHRLGSQIFPPKLKTQRPQQQQPKNSSPAARNQEAATMRGRRSRGGARAPPGARPTSMDSRSSPEATVEEELQVRNVQEETEEETRARKHHGEDGQGSSSSSSFVVPESRSRFWPAAREADENSAALTSPSRFWGGAPQGGKNSRSPSWSAGRSSLERSTVPDVAGASESVPVVVARADRMGEEAKSELQRAAGKIEGVTAFTKMELPKPPREFATNRPHRDVSAVSDSWISDCRVPSRSVSNQSPPLFSGCASLFCSLSFRSIFILAVTGMRIVMFVFCFMFVQELLPV